MKKIFLFFVIVGFVVLGVLFWKRTDQTRLTSIPNGQVTDSTRSVGTKETVSSDRYREFSPQVLAEAANGRRVLFFYANWCPTCRPTDENFLENSTKFPADLTLIRVNYNDDQTDAAEKELARKYAVTYQHTFVQIDSQGNVVGKWNGGQTDELLTNLK